MASVLSRRGTAAGFTLLEMLVVLVIIGLVAGLVGPRLFSKVDSSKVQTAGVQIKLLRGALETMRMDVGNYPSADVGLAMLTTAPSDPAQRARWKGPYLDEGVPLDPWGNPYQYRVPGEDGRPFAIVSLGADGKPGGEGIDADIGQTSNATPAR
jgi:general secretion pathway protein G